jgi:hypothetical protein
MKNSVFILLLAITLTFSLSAQTQKKIPSLSGNHFSNGWHKFIVKNAVFDVEISERKLVKGNIVWTDKSKYSGSFIGQEIGGRGTFTWADGLRYEGSFKANKRHGWGQMYYLDGTIYNGKWKADKKEGKGKLYDQNGNILKEGFWQNDKFIGTKKKRKNK